MKGVFQIARYKESECGKLILDVWVQRPRWAVDTSALRLEYQNDPGHLAWYAPSMTIRSDATERLLHHMAKARRILVGWEKTEARSLKAKVDWLLAQQFTRIVYDARLSEWVDANKVLPSNYSRWLDDYKRWGQTACSVSCIATTEAQAQEELTREWGRRIEADPGKAEKLARWASEGKPVMWDIYSRAPVVEDLDLVVSGQEATAPKEPVPPL